MPCWLNWIQSLACSMYPSAATPCSKPGYMSTISMVPYFIKRENWFRAKSEKKLFPLFPIYFPSNEQRRPPHFLECYVRAWCQEKVSFKRAVLTNFKHSLAVHGNITCACHTVSSFIELSMKWSGFPNYRKSSALLNISPLFPRQMTRHFCFIAFCCWHVVQHREQHSKRFLTGLSNEVFQ